MASVLLHIKKGNNLLQNDILTDATNQQFDATIPYGPANNPFQVKVVSSDKVKLYDWCQKFESESNIIILYYDKDHPSNKNFKIKNNIKTSTIPVKSDISSPEVTYTGNYILGGYYLTSAMGVIYRFPQPSLKHRPTIGIISFGGAIYANDALTYWGSSYLNLVAPNIPTLTIVPVDGWTNVSGMGDAENALDIQTIGGCCNNANIIMYIANVDTEANVLDLFTAAVIDTTHNPQVISCSWGYGANNPDATDDILALAVSKGINIVAASGDGGSAALATYPWPMSSPNVIACGGTNLASPHLYYYSTTTQETGWFEADHSSTGGVTVYPIPSYQLGTVNNVNSSRNRCIPDVCYPAGQPGNEYAVITILNGSNAMNSGTSWSAPTLAALIGILGVKKFLNPILYANLNSSIKWYHTVTGGSNGAYLCHPGYNLVTGIGSIDGLFLQQLLQELGII